MARRVLALLGATLAAAGCSGGKSALLVRMTAAPALRGVTSVDVSVGGVMRRYPASPPVDLVEGSPRTLVAVLPGSLSGVFSVEVRATGAGGLRGSGAAEVMIGPGEESIVDVVLRPEAMADLGAPPDLAAADLATPDLAAVDLLAPDLAMPDLAVPDLAVVVDMTVRDQATPVDRAMPDLAISDLAVPRDLAVAPDLARPPDLLVPIDMAGGCLMGCNLGLACCVAQCIDTATSTDHCGKCGNKCPAPANAVATCTKGACSFACNAGFGNCDGNANNGCEQDTASDVRHCGACNNVCFQTQSSVTDCIAGKCSPLPCRLGTLNCDLDPANGCEVNVENDRMNCGKCGIACPLPLGCFAGICQ